MAFSAFLPVVIRADRSGGKPNLRGIGKSQGTPSLVSVSITKWLSMPIIKATTPTEYLLLA